MRNRHFWYMIYFPPFSFIKINNMCDECSTRAPSLSDLHSMEILLHLNEMRSNRTLCDVSLCVEGCNIPVHKVVLSASSPYFKAMFTQVREQKNLVFFVHSTFPSCGD